ncbi:Hok/Gef family protein [Salmonella enterica subsp. enterica serovar Oranienburg]|nr:Hok/Gef family protein [Salmonella enterica subsp. enterica serovar Oranienburg]EHH3041493.1 Hok/Gef family protein [Salmonella enterica subsp. enterica serovar Oranienburg]
MADIKNGEKRPIILALTMVRDSLCGLRLQQGNTELVATLAYEVKR